MRIFPLLCATTALAMPVAAYSQQITTVIGGQVTDQAGAPLSGASVVVTDTRTGAERSFTTGTEGTFSASGLTTGGPYTVTATLPGFQGQTVEQVFTSLQGETRLTFALEGEATAGEETIVVTGSRVGLSRLAVGPGQSFNEEVLAAAPSFNRDVRDIIRIDPRVSLDRDDGGSGVDRISCLGGNDRGNSFTVDGIPQGDVYGLNDTGFSSRSSTPLPYDAIRETQVQFAPFDVDYGQFTGCAINVVTKSGTNRITASGFFEYSNSDLRGDEVAGNPITSIRPEKRWGVTLGGPVIKDRLFLFGAYEHQEAGQSQDEGPIGGGYANEQVGDKNNPNDGITVAQFNEIRGVLRDVYGIDTGDLVHNRDYTNDRYFARADLQITDQHRLEATYQHLEEMTVKSDDLFTGTSPQAVGANTFYNSGTKSDYYSGRLYSQWNDQLSTELRYSHSKIQDLQDPIGGGEAQSGNPIPRIIVGIDNPTGVDGSVMAGPGNSRTANDLRTTIDQYRAVANLVVGNHKLKFGAELNHADLFNLFVQNATGTLVFRNINDLRLGLLSPGTVPGSRACTAATTTTTPVNVVNGCTYGAFGNFSSTGDVTSAAAQFKRDIYSVYLQDEWTAMEGLKITAGVRTDWYDGGHPNYNPVFATRYGFGNSTGFSNLDPVILPRLGFTYDFANEGLFSRSQLVGGVGIFSGGDPLVWFGNAFQNDGRGFALGNSSTASGCPAGQISVLTNGTFTGVPSCIQTNAIATAAAGRGFTQSIDPDLKLPTVVRANIGFRTRLNFTETGFFSGWNGVVDYIYSEFRNPYTLVDLAQTIDTRRGLNGYTIDGRPIYSSIDLLATGCTGRLVNPGAPPVYENVNNACYSNSRYDELMLTNQDGYRSHVASILLSKNFERGLITEGGSTWVSFGYSYTNSHDRRNLYNSTAGSNYDQTAAFDRQNPDASPGFYQSKHNFTFATNFKNEFFSDLATSLGFTFVARSGRPYSLTWSGSGVFNNSNSGSDNALIYIPTGMNDPNVSPLSNATAVEDLVDFANGLDCARKFSGKTVTRNACTNDWYFDLDLNLSQEVPGPGRFFGRDDKIKIYAMFDNFLNFLDNKWNVQRRRTYYGVQDLASLGSRTVGTATYNGVDADGKYIINTFTGNTFDSDNQINISSSVWRIKVGASYQF